MMDIRAAARALGGQPYGRDSVLFHPPGHSNKGSYEASVRFGDFPDGFWITCFAGDDEIAVRDYVRQMLGIGGFQPGEGRGPDRPVIRERIKREPEPEAVRRREFALSLWHEARPIGGTLAAVYLRARGIAAPAEALDGNALRFHPACPFRLDSGETIRLPTMLGGMLNIQTNDFQGVHRTALAADGSGKARVAGLPVPRKMLGGSEAAAVKLTADENVTLGLGIAEGIETALAIMAMGFRPMWSVLSAGTMRRFPVLPGVDAITVFADNDKSGTGQTAAQECASRWIEAGREAAIWMPPMLAPDDPESKGTDFNDLAGRAAA